MGLATTMASTLDNIAKLPPWQRVVVWLLVAGLLGLGWYYLWYADAVAAREADEAALQKTEQERQQMEAKLENFEEQQRAAAAAEKEIQAQMEVLPMGASTVDNLMQTFQQQARLVGLSIESWTPGAEEKLDFYAKLPVRIRAVGSWHQGGEFFRRVSELRQIVSVEALSLKARGDRNVGVAQPVLEVDFTASTYRFLTDEERVAAGGKQATRRKGGAGP